jgi:autotransporter-associated beta strand protein
LVIAGGALLSSTSAVTQTWTGAGDDNKFSTAANWASGTAPATGDALVFNGTDGEALTLQNDLAIQPPQFYFYGTTAYTFTSSSGTTDIQLNNNTGFYNYSEATQTFQTDVNNHESTLFFYNDPVKQGSITISGTTFITGRDMRNAMVGGTLTLGGLSRVGGDLNISGMDYIPTNPVVAGQPLPVTVVGNITAGRLFNFSNFGLVTYGELRLTGSNAITGDTQFIDANLVLDYTNDYGKLGAGNLVFNGSRVRLVGGTTQESVSWLLLGYNREYWIDGGGQTTIERVSGSATIKLSGNIKRNAAGTGALADTWIANTLSLGESGLIYSVGSNSGVNEGSGNVNGIIRPWVTVGGEGSAGRDWAFRDADGYIKAFKAYESGTNALIEGSPAAMVENTTINSLKLDSNSGDAPQDILDLNQLTLTVKSGGLMFVGAKDYAINSGTLRMGEDSLDEFMVWQSGLGELTVNSELVARSITKDGTGTLTLNGTFNPQAIATATTGGIYLNNGVLKLGENWSGNTAHMVLMPTSGTLNLNGNDLQVNAIGADGQSPVPARITNDAAELSTLTVAPSGSLGIRLSGLVGIILDGNLKLVITGSAYASNYWLSTYTANTHTGGVTISNNMDFITTFNIQNAAWFGTGTLTLAGNAGINLANTTRYGWDNFTTPLHVTGTNNRFIGQYTGITFNNAWSGGGELIIEANSDNFGQQYFDRNMRINADMSAFSGTLRLRSSILGVARGVTFSSDNAVADWSTASVVFEPGGTTATFGVAILESRLANQTYKIGNLSSTGNAVVGGTGNQTILRNTNGNGTLTFEVGALNLSGTFDGHISNMGQTNGAWDGAGLSFYEQYPDGRLSALTKVGTGTLTLTNENTYKGATTVSGGVLLVSGSGSLNRTAGVNVSTGGAFVYDSAVALDRAVNVSEGGLFGGSGDVSGVNLILAKNAELTGGGVLSTGTLTLSKALTLDDFTYQWDIAADDDYDLLDFTGDLTLTGDNYTVNVNALNGLGVLSDFENLIILSGLQTGNLELWSLTQAAADAGFTLDFQGANLLLNYSAIPEPSTWALMVTGVALLAILRRRR